MRLLRGIVKESVGATRSGELLVDEATEGRADHAVVRWSLRHATHDKIDVVGMEVGRAQFSHHLTTDDSRSSTRSLSLNVGSMGKKKVSYLRGNVIQEIVETPGDRKPAVLAIIIVPWEAMITTTLDVQADGIQAQIAAVAGIQFACHLSTQEQARGIIAKRSFRNVRRVRAGRRKQV